MADLNHFSWSAELPHITPIYPMRLCMVFRTLLEIFNNKLTFHGSFYAHKAFVNIITQKTLYKSKKNWNDSCLNEKSAILPHVTLSKVIFACCFLHSLSLLAEKKYFFISLRNTMSKLTKVINNIVETCGLLLLVQSSFSSFLKN